MAKLTIMKLIYSDNPLFFDALIKHGVQEIILQA